MDFINEDLFTVEEIENNQFLETYDPLNVDHFQETIEETDLFSPLFGENNEHYDRCLRLHYRLTDLIEESNAIVKSLLS